jgi:DNA invertase Pin-like site-specific DNA recombinase
MKVIGYCRVSTEDQVQGSSLDQQKEQIEAEAKRRGWELVEIVEDQGKSAKSLKRPGIRRVLEALSRGEAQGLVVSKLDRLSRSMHDFSGMLERARKEGWSLACLDVGVDTSSAAGEAMSSVIATFAQFERRRNGERTAEGIKKYREANPQKGWGGTVVGPKIVAQIKAKRKKGLTLATIAQDLNSKGIKTARGGKSWHASTVRSVLLRG